MIRHLVVFVLKSHLEGWLEGLVASISRGRRLTRKVASIFVFTYKKLPESKIACRSCIVLVSCKHTVIQGHGCGECTTPTKLPEGDRQQRVVQSRTDVQQKPSYKHDTKSSTVRSQQQSLISATIQLKNPVEPASSAQCDNSRSQQRQCYKKKTDHSTGLRTN